CKSVNWRGKGSSSAMLPANVRPRSTVSTSDITAKRTAIKIVGEPFVACFLCTHIPNKTATANHHIPAANKTNARPNKTGENIINAVASIIEPKHKDTCTTYAVVLADITCIPVATGSICINAPAITLPNTPRVNKCVMASAELFHLEIKVVGPYQNNSIPASSTNAGVLTIKRKGMLKGGGESK